MTEVVVAVVAACASSATLSAWLAFRWSREARRHAWRADRALERAVMLGDAIAGVLAHAPAGEDRQPPA